MTADTRSKIDKLRALQAGMPTMASPTPRSNPHSKRTDFSTLSHLKQVSIARGTGSVLGFENPFFRRIERLDGIRAMIGGAWIQNFASYDYLSLNNDPRIAAAVADAVKDFGVSATASRLVGGDRPLHGELETRLARFLGTEDAIVTVSGHATNLAIIRTLMGPGDLVVADAFAHNSVFEGIRASGAAHATFAHNDLDQLSEKLDKTRDRYERVLIVAEGLYSMDGDVPDLAGLIALKERHEAWLMLDEAHALGVLGSEGRGSAEEAGIDVGKIDILMGTLSKALCSCGGYVAGCRDLVDALRYAAPGFVYSVGLSVPNAAAANAALHILEQEPERVAALRARSGQFRAAAQSAGLDTGGARGFAVAPVIIGDSLRAVWASNALLDRGVNALPIIAPAVPNKSARLRFFLNAHHPEEVVAKAVALTAEVVSEAAGQKF